MKGTKKQIKNKKVYKGGGTSKRARRAHLHSGNHAYNTYMRTHRMQAQLPGYPQGTHVAKDTSCRCGGCNTKEEV